MTPSIPLTSSTTSNVLHGAPLDMSGPSHPSTVLVDDESDYGEFTVDEQNIIDDLLAQAGSSGAHGDELLKLTDIEDYEEPKDVHLPKTLGKESWTPPWMRQQARPMAAPPISVDHKASHNTSFGKVDSAAEEKRAQRRREASTEPEPATSNTDTRSPIERFRTKPKKALSVTDLISPAWCELQYFYSLSRHGKKRATPAMRQGTRVHKKLEEEVHTTVRVSITTKEDSWGLRIWNVIQGLRTLRATGKTRELEVWGFVDGEIISGVIDELGYECPDPDFADQEARRLAKAQDGKEEKAPDQPSITEYLLSSAGGNGKTFDQFGTGLENSMRPPLMPKRDDKKIYITDIKTRTVKSLPSALVTRPTEVQLQLYHYMLTALAQGSVSLTPFAERYNFDPGVTFSDSFIAQVGGLNEQFFDAISSQSQTDENSASHSTPASSQDSTDLLLKYNTVSSLWNLMIEQFQHTFLLDPPPPPPPSFAPLPSPPQPHPSKKTPLLNPPVPTRLSPLLTATYIHQPYSGDAAINLGNKTFIYSAAKLSAYVADEMAWWRGERKARGVVELNEVSAKCSRCEFLAECEWARERERSVLAGVMERKKEGRMREGQEGGQGRGATGQVE